jgi:hypothetical protein
MGMRRGALGIDPAMGDEAAVTLRAALASRNWPMVREVLTNAEHPDDRAFYLDVCGTVPGVQESIGEWAAAEPQSYLHQLVRGCHAVRGAWDLLSERFITNGREQHYQLFADRLRFADACLQDVVGRNPDEVAAWAFMVSIARGLRMHVDHVRHRFTEAVRRHPTSLKAHAEMMFTLCQRWQGSHQQMNAFVTEAAKNSPPGSLLPYLVPLGHIEVTLDLEGPIRPEYMQTTRVRTALADAAEQSVFHPAADLGPGWQEAANTFALAFDLSGDRRAAAAVFEMLGPVVTRHPWNYLGHGNEVDAFAAARSRALMR